MKEQTYFDDKIVETAEIQIDIKEVYARKLSSITSLFKKMFGEKPGIFKLIRNYMYYVPGVPRDDSKGRFIEEMARFVTIVHWYSLLGQKSKIDSILSNFGMTLYHSPVSTIDISSNKGAKKLWAELFPNDTFPSAADVAMTKLLEESAKSLSSVQALKKEIDVTTKNVEQKCEINPSVFKKAMSLKAKKLEGKDISDNVKSIEDKADQLSDAIERL